jgi:hypothetical protein
VAKCSKTSLSGVNDGGLVGKEATKMSAQKQLEDITDTYLFL